MLNLARYPLTLVLLGTACGNDPPQGPSITSPPARSGHALAYDEGRHVVLLFGGISGSTLRGDFWSWDGQRWQRLPDGPTARVDASLVYDAARNRAVLYGGRLGHDPTAATLDDTWEWDGNAWTRRAETGPGMRVHQAVAYDRARARTVLFGGFNPSTANSRSDFWEWDGASWSLRPVSGPAEAFAPVMAYDEKNEYAILVTVRTSDLKLLTWSYNGAALAPLASDGPVAIPPGGLATRGPNGGAIFFGGSDGQVVVATTSTWDGR